MTDKTPKRSRPSIATKFTSEPASELTSEKMNGVNVFTYKLADGNKQMKSLVSRRGTTNRDTLKFGEGISKNDINFEVMGENLKITIAGAKPGQLLIRGFCSTEYNLSQTFSFKKIEIDGYTLPITSVRKKLLSGMQPEWQPVLQPKIATPLMIPIAMENGTRLDQLTNAVSTLSDKPAISSPKETLFCTGQGQQAINYYSMLYCSPSF